MAESNSGNSGNSSSNSSPLYVFDVFLEEKDGPGMARAHAEYALALFSGLRDARVYQTDYVPLGAGRRTNRAPGSGNVKRTFYVGGSGRDETEGRLRQVLAEVRKEHPEVCKTIVEVTFRHAILREKRGVGWAHRCQIL